MLCQYFIFVCIDGYSAGGVGGGSSGGNGVLYDGYKAGGTGGGLSSNNDGIGQSGRTTYSISGAGGGGAMWPAVSSFELFTIVVKYIYILYI